MNLIDFTEIPDGQAFEDFAALFLQIAYGFRVAVHPAVGPDGGRDLVCEETNAFGGQGFRWLGSCKHFARSGRNVGEHDDEARANKLVEFGCHGFLFVYSTQHTQYLSNAIENVARQVRVPYRIVGPAEITQTLVSRPQLYPLVRQFFPVSHDRLIGCVQAGISCCSGGLHDVQYATYAVSTRDPQTHSISVTLICDGCIQDHVEYLQERGIEYGAIKVTEAVHW